MIELTSEQREAIRQMNGPLLRCIDPDSGETFVLVRADHYETLDPTFHDYDDSPWTVEEMDLLSAERADMAGWEGMDVYQDDNP